MYGFQSRLLGIDTNLALTNRVIMQARGTSVENFVRGNDFYRIYLKDLDDIEKDCRMSEALKTYRLHFFFSRRFYT